MNINSLYPKISIITPCFNSEKYLEETILSVLEQNYPNLEYIIIDGGSTDNSLQIIRKYQNNLSYWISEKDNGIYDALQKGFSRTTGDIMAWINSDDLYHKNSFYIIAELFNKYHNINWLVGATTIFDEKSRCVCISKSHNFTKYDFYMMDFKWIQQESCFWRRSLWEKSGSYINATLKYAGDLDLWIRFFNYEPLYVTDSLIGGFRKRSKNQLSLEFMNDYLIESYSLLKNQVIDKKDKLLINKYNNLLKLLNIFNKFKLINAKGLLNYYRKKYFNLPNNIIFNRELQQFEIEN